MFTRQHFSSLAEHTEGTAISIYMPTHRAGQETHNGHDALMLKDALKDARQQLEKAKELDERAIDKMLAPADKLVDDATFWRNQSDALALFIGADKFHHFSMPLHIETPQVTVGNEFTLLPAAQMLSPGARWYTFVVTQNSNSFFECTRNSITSIRIGDLVPKDMEEVLEIYEGSETLQHHGAPKAQGGGGSVFSGQGSNEDRRDERLEIYFRRIGNGITDLIAGSEEPLVIVADDQHIAGIKAEIDYPHIVEGGVGVHPNAMDPVAIQAATWKLVEPLFKRTTDDLQDKYASANGGGNLTHGLADVVPAASTGRVAALMVSSAALGRMGHYDVNKNAVKFGSEKTDKNLLETAIRETVDKGGQVLFRPADEVADKSDGVTAVLRFDY